MLYAHSYIILCRMQLKRSISPMTMSSYRYIFCLYCFFFLLVVLSKKKWIWNWRQLFCIWFIHYYVCIYRFINKGWFSFRLTSYSLWTWWRNNIQTDWFLPSLTLCISPAINESLILCINHWVAYKFNYSCSNHCLTFDTYIHIYHLYKHIFLIDAGRNVKSWMPQANIEQFHSGIRYI